MALLNASSPYWTIKEIIWWEDKNTDKICQRMTVADFRKRTFVLQSEANTRQDCNLQMNEALAMLAAEIEEEAIASGTSPTP